MQNIKAKLDETTFKLFAIMFLGNPPEKRNLHETKYYFKAWGILHLLARSGLHLIFFILLLRLLLQLLPCAYPIKQLILLLAVVFYSALSWPSIPFIRASYLFFLYSIALFFRYPTHFLHFLSVVCCATLINNPMQLFAIEFQLSFGITGALALFNVIYE